ncbi:MULTISPECIES: hypothetical protein [Jonquetella]|uniref:Cell division protein SepF n=1 Tax=Jonquetella anthropi DSM 22815 TaxID=885272 RepID=H0UKR9_9BACT|nr:MULTISPECIES: hypothetical protein [Jonquetella]EEX48304.1 hypothetical protein GCWU000246_01142 [Jonquetella anthropi E3_33 E1]EHM13278.1 hypothetical protein JonanDRAFT_0905 [Jonquetella anthropi DSM 22815]ERL23641.1 hypothetical protein HMPREF1249_1008 [Jonquetella sp. BV3C21]
MLEKIKELFGMNGENAGSQSYRAQKRRQWQQQEEGAAGQERRRLTKDLPPYEGENKAPQNKVESESVPVILVRGDNVAAMADNLLEAIRSGQIVLVDFHGAEPIAAQGVLDELVDQARKWQYGVFRISSATFLFCSAQGVVEEWVPDIDGAVYAAR